MTQKEYSLDKCVKKTEAMQFAIILANNLTKFGRGNFKPSVREHKSGCWIPTATCED